jgi:hypothetical protein
MSNSTPVKLSWASIATKSRSAEILDQINQAEQLQQQKARKQLEAKQAQKEKEQQQREEQQRLGLERHIQRMKAKYGSNWHNHVDRTKDDCAEAERLRYKEAVAYDQYMEQIEAEDRHFDELYERNLKTMTRKQFQQWQEELDDEYDSHVAQVEGAFTSRASQAAISYYHKTGIMRNSNDFAGNHAQAPLKPGIRF